MCFVGKYLIQCLTEVEIALQSQMSHYCCGVSGEGIITKIHSANSLFHLVMMVTNVGKHLYPKRVTSPQDLTLI